MAKFRRINQNDIEERKQVALMGEISHAGKQSWLSEEDGDSRIQLDLRQEVKFSAVSLNRSAKSLSLPTIRR